MPFPKPLAQCWDETLRAKTDELGARIVQSIGNVESLDERDKLKARQETLAEILPIR